MPRKKPPKKRHRWTYASSYSSPTKINPATCPCGARYFIRRRPKKAPTGYRDALGTDEITFIITPDGVTLVDPKPTPECLR